MERQRKLKKGQNIKDFPLKTICFRIQEQQQCKVFCALEALVKRQPIVSSHTRTYVLDKVYHELCVCVPTYLPTYLMNSPYAFCIDFKC